MTDETFALEFVNRETGDVSEQIDITGWDYAACDKALERLTTANFARCVRTTNGKRTAMWNRWNGETPARAFLGDMSTPSTHAPDVSQKTGNDDMTEEEFQTTKGLVFGGETIHGFAVLTPARAKSLVNEVERLRAEVADLKHQLEEACSR